MTSKNQQPNVPAKQPGVVKPNHTHGSEVGTLAGEVAGGLLGLAAGPPGAIAGMVIGATVGAVVGEVMDREADRAHRHDEELDEAIGVSSGELGAPNLQHPPAKVGAFSSASAVASGVGDRSPAEGPIPQDE